MHFLYSIYIKIFDFNIKIVEYFILHFNFYMLYNLYFILNNYNLLNYT